MYNKLIIEVIIYACLYHGLKYKIWVWGTYMINNGDELRELVLLVEKFVEIADELKRHGKIDEEQHTYITSNKVEFLKEARRTME